ncbi:MULTISPECIES: hypothetical protein [unclassified Sphingomonas]|uniref:hypothetical protein n=1 Tax=unclassified Sphingomonas TaxID=196159 RepID=UPI001E4CA614|nr:MULTISPECIES: hypothetical protein [unclassified Sphingomonas]
MRVDAKSGFIGVRPDGNSIKAEIFTSTSGCPDDLIVGMIQPMAARAEWCSDFDPAPSVVVGGVDSQA